MKEAIMVRETPRGLQVRQGDKIRITYLIEGFPSTQEKETEVCPIFLRFPKSPHIGMQLCGDEIIIAIYGGFLKTFDANDSIVTYYEFTVAH